MENSVLPLVWKLYFEELSSAVHSQFSTHFVPRRLHSPSSTLTRFHFQKEKRDDTLTTCSHYFRESFSMIFQHQSRSLWKKTLKNFRKRYLLYGGTAISKLYKTEKRWKTIIPVKSIRAKPIPSTFPGKGKRFFQDTHSSHHLWKYPSPRW